MHMSFWFDTVVGDFLFRGYAITSSSGLVSTCFGLVSLAILFEGVKVYLVSLKECQKDVITTSLQNEESCPDDRSLLLKQLEVHRKSKRNVAALLHQVVWYTVQNVLGYILMLAVMTFNGYFTIAVCLGAGFGYFVFSSELMAMGLRNADMRQLKRECPMCRKGGSQEQDPSEDDQEGSSVMSEVAQGLVQAVSMNSKGESSASNVTSVALVHQAEES